LSEDRAVINRMGFNNGGMDAAAARLARRKRAGIVGINIGANKESSDRIADYRAAFAALAPLADYVTVNVSSPNTPGLRGLQNREELTALLSSLTQTRAKLSLRTPLLLKIAPDLDENALDDIAAVLDGAGIEGLIVSNTTIARPPALKSPNAKEQGGLSGAPLFTPSTEILRQMRRRTALPLIGVGGIESGADAYAKIRAGASLVQLYTALAYRGPGLVTRIKRELLECLTRDDFATLNDAIGAR
jgi:dihydroorotate dehydrogenase